MYKTVLYLLYTALLFSGFLLTGCSSKQNRMRLPHKTKHTQTSAATHKATMRAYNVRGKRYYPSYVEVGQTMHGISSWYGPNFHGKYTSNGEIYDMYARTAAHKTWPMDTMVKVRNLQNGKSTIVRINDRGPFVRGRIIDCSYTAGKELGLDKMGIAKVSIEVLGFSGKVESSSKNRVHKVTRIVLSNFGLQVGAFRKSSGAEYTRKQYAQRYPQYKSIVKRFSSADGTLLYRVWMMGFKSDQEAKDFKNSHHLMGAFIIRN